MYIHRNQLVHHYDKFQNPMMMYMHLFHLNRKHLMRHVENRTKKEVEQKNGFKKRTNR